MGAISWIVDSLLYDEAIAEAEEEQRLREREATPEQREQDKEDGVDDQVPIYCLLSFVEHDERTEERMCGFRGAGELSTISCRRCAEYLCISSYRGTCFSICRCCSAFAVPVDRPLDRRDLFE